MRACEIKQKSSRKLHFYSIFLSRAPHDLIKMLYASLSYTNIQFGKSRIFSPYRVVFLARLPGEWGGGVPEGTALTCSECLITR